MLESSLYLPGKRHKKPGPEETHNDAKYFLVKQPSQITLKGRLQSIITSAQTISTQHDNVLLLKKKKKKADNQKLSDTRGRLPI
jgi:hypothetical protein